MKGYGYWVCWVEPGSRSDLKSGVEPASHEHMEPLQGPLLTVSEAPGAPQLLPQGSAELCVLSSCLCLVSEGGGATASAIDKSTPRPVAGIPGFRALAVAWCCIRTQPGT